MGIREKIKNVTDRIRDYLENSYGEGVKKIILYGSHARNKANAHSDVDILVVVDDSLDPSVVRRELGDLILDILLEEGELVSVVVVRESFFEESSFPFMLNVKEEGTAV